MTTPTPTAPAVAGSIDLRPLFAPRSIAVVGASPRSWIAETVLIFLFVPGLAVLYALMGLWLWLREVNPERTALVVAMPVAVLSR